MSVSAIILAQLAEAEADNQPLTVVLTVRLRGLIERDEELNALVTETARAVNEQVESLQLYPIIGTIKVRGRAKLIRALSNHPQVAAANSGLTQAPFMLRAK